MGFKGSSWLLGGVPEEGGRDQGPGRRLLNNPHRKLLAAGVLSHGVSGCVWRWDWCISDGLHVG